MKVRHLPRTNLADHPAQEQRLAGGLGVEGDALGFAGAGEQRMAPGEVGEGGERGVLVELFEDEFLGAGADAREKGRDLGDEVPLFPRERKRDAETFRAHTAEAPGVCVAAMTSGKSARSLAGLAGAGEPKAGAARVVGVSSVSPLECLPQEPSG